MFLYWYLTFLFLCLLIFPFLLSLVHVCMCMGMFACVCVHVWRPGVDVNVFFNCCPLYFLRQVCHSPIRGSSGLPACSRSSQSLRLKHRGYRSATILAQLLCGSGYPNSGCHACVGGTLSIEPSLQTWYSTSSKSQAPSLGLENHTSFLSTVLKMLPPMMEITHPVHKA